MNSKILSFFIGALIPLFFIALYGCFAEIYNNQTATFLQTLVIMIQTMVICYGFKLAVKEYILNNEKQTQKDKEKNEQAYLELAKQEFMQVEKLLQDRNNNREKWIKASKLLISAYIKADEIQEQYLKNQYILYEDILKNKLLEIVYYDGSGFPPQFFMGNDEWEEEAKDKKSLEEIHKKFRSELEVNTISINCNAYINDIKMLDRESVVVIYDFLKKITHKNPSDIKIWKTKPSDIGFDKSCQQGANRYVLFRQNNNKDPFAHTNNITGCN
jgi:hypothetical protein